MIARLETENAELRCQSSELNTRDEEVRMDAALEVSRVSDLEDENKRLKENVEALEKVSEAKGREAEAKTEQMKKCRGRRGEARKRWSK